ncbi:hypothetical protein GDO81_016571 [Engystomops pustulosus]|uniref:Uncharacterized protein n=1 Tax=Engystomops pustulosus TaxID=76066 RepID=A0AAV7AY48_ENGPU|nr:hypothetical protein GDO81_016571 [Engystomops pustulosus]
MTQYYIWAVYFSGTTILGQNIALPHDLVCSRCRFFTIGNAESCTMDAVSIDPPPIAPVSGFGVSKCYCGSYPNIHKFIYV